MSVHFVYRSHYEGPSGKHVRRLDADSVLGWFRAVWVRAKRADDVSAVDLSARKEVARIKVGRMPKLLLTVVAPERRSSAGDSGGR
jgi:hypothetical protein